MVLKPTIDIILTYPHIIKWTSVNMSERYISAKIIDNLYKEFLGRNADPDGLRYHMRHFEELGVARGTQHSVSILMNSDEFQINKMHRGKLILKTDNKRINGNKVSHIISLGSHCLPALTLRKYGLKGKTLPFDWTYAHPKLVLDCLENGFSSLLNTSNIHTISRGIKSTNIKYWWDSKYHTFPHHDLNDHGELLKFERYANRFNEILNSGDSKIFLIISRRMYDLSSHIIKIKDALIRRTSNFKLIGIQLVSDDKYQYPVGLNEVFNDGVCEFYNFSSLSMEEGIGQFQSAFDEMIIISLLSRFEIDIKI